MLLPGSQPASLLRLFNRAQLPDVHPSLACSSGLPPLDRITLKQSLNSSAKIRPPQKRVQFQESFSTPSPDRSPLAFFTALAGLITPRGAQRNARWLAAAAPARTRTDGYLFILLYLTPLREAEQRRCSARSPAMSRSRSRQAEPRHGRRRRRVRESLDRQQHSSSS